MGRAAVIFALSIAWFASAMTAYSQIDEPNSSLASGYGVTPTVVAAAETSE